MVVKFFVKYYEGIRYEAREGKMRRYNRKYF